MTGQTYTSTGQRVAIVSTVRLGRYLIMLVPGILWTEWNGIQNQPFSVPDCSQEPIVSKIILKLHQWKFFPV